MACRFRVLSRAGDCGTGPLSIVEVGGWSFVQLEPHGQQTNKYRGSGEGHLWGGAPRERKQHYVPTYFGSVKKGRRKSLKVRWYLVYVFLIVGTRSPAEQD